jgi:hypothetical protein
MTLTLYASDEGRGGGDLTAVIGMQPSGLPPEFRFRSVITAPWKRSPQACVAWGQVDQQAVD